MDDLESSLCLRYVGDRYKGARLPVDVLSDLPALRDLIAALAKQDFRQKNPDRKRVPQGFDRRIAFALTESRDGSAIPVLELELDVAQQNLPNIGNKMQGIVGKAYIRAVEIFKDASIDKYPKALPQDAIRALSKFGANIRDDERIEFVGKNHEDGNVVSLDQHKRKQLLTRIRETYTIQYEDVGILTGIDATHNTIQVQTERFGEIRVDLDGVSMPAEQFDGNLHSPVEFSISIALDAHDEISAIEEVHSVDLVRPYDEHVKRCLTRLQEISRNEKGWLGEDHGEQLVHLAGMRATQLIFARADLAKLFHIFPTEDGGVSIEFDIADWSFAVEIFPDGRLEIDGSSPNGAVSEAKDFPGFNAEFFAAFDKMTGVANEED